MADPTLVNGQITDAVTQANVKVLADAPAEALGSLYQVMAHSTGIGMQNATAFQQQFNNVSNAVITQGVNGIYSLDVAADAEGTQTIFQSTLPQLLIQLQAVLEAFTVPPPPLKVDKVKTVTPPLPI